MSSSPAAPRPTRSALISGISLTLCVTLGSVGYAYLARATYRSSASVVLTASETERHGLSPLEAARRLSEAILDRELMDQLATELAPSADPSERLQAGRRVRSALEVESIDGLHFTISSRAESAERAFSLTQRFSEKAVAVAPRVLAPDRRAERQRLDAERRRKSDELVNFLTQHPELKNDDSSAPGQAQAEPPRERLLRELLVERAAVEARLATRGMSPPSDNPYAQAGPQESDVAQLERRLAQLNTAISSERNAARHTTPPNKAKSKPADAQQWAEFQRLLRELESARAASDAARQTPAGLSAQLSSSAVRPSAPVDPNRAAILKWCAWFAPLTGLMLGAFVFLRSHRRLSSMLWSSAPPKPRTGSSAPALIAPATSEKATQSNQTHPSFIELNRSGEGAKSGLNPFERNSAAAPWVMDVHGSPVSAPSEAQPRSSGRGTNGSARGRASGPQPEESALTNPLPRQAPLGIGLASGAALRETQMLGSPLPPILYPHRAFHSSKPPDSDNPQRRLSSQPPSSALRARAARDVTPILALPVDAGWKPEAGLNPDARRALCDEIYPLAVDHCFVIGVSGTAATRHEKSRLAAELALALSESEHPRVLLLEGDLRSPAVHHWLRLDMPKGRAFSEQIEERVAHASVRSWVVMECLRSLHVLAEGPRPKPDLLLSHYFERCVLELRSYYDFILINGPIISELAHCRALHDVVDEVLLVHTAPNAADVADAFELFSGKRLVLVQGAVQGGQR